MKKLASVIHTKDHYAGLIVRLTLAVVILPHGLQQLLGWFGGYGFENTMKYYATSHNLPWIIGFLVIFLQSFGALLILTGIAGRLIAFGTIILFAGMIFTSHISHGFFMNWTGNQTGEGYEYHLLVIGLAFTLLSEGSGKFSVDNWISKIQENDLKNGIKKRGLVTQREII